MKLTENTAYLLTLGFPDSIAQQIMKLRTQLFSLVKHISFVSLPPMIALAWQHEPFPPLSHLHLPTPPSPSLFSSLKERNNALFLVHGTEAFALWFSQLAVHRECTEDVQEVLFPIVPGIFLGNPGTYRLPITNVPQIRISDWRLQHYRIKTLYDRDNLVHVRYALLDDLHLR
jgi:hypothetical protein